MLREALVLIGLLLFGLSSSVTAATKIRFLNGIQNDILDARRFLFGGAGRGEYRQQKGQGDELGDFQGRIL